MNDERWPRWVGWLVSAALSLALWIGIIILIRACYEVMK